MLKTTQEIGWTHHSAVARTKELEMAIFFGRKRVKIRVAMCECCYFCARGGYGDEPYVRVHMVKILVEWTLVHAMADYCALEISGDDGGGHIGGIYLKIVVVLLEMCFVVQSTFLFKPELYREDYGRGKSCS
jgi:hypothetical protein